MTNQASPTTTGIHNRTLLLRFLLILFVSAFSALGFTSLTGRVRLFPGMSLAIDLAGAAGIGLTAGFFTRILLNDRRNFLRMMVSLGGVLAGLLVFGAMTYWNYGIGPLYFFRSTVDWLGLGLITISGVSALLSGQAYRAPVGSASQPLEGDTRPTIRGSQSRTARTTPVMRKTGRKLKAPKKVAGKARKSTAGKAKIGGGKVKRTAITSKPGRPTGKTVIRRKPSKKIVLAPVEIHRCPYCLEPVKRNDPRGVVECDVCHTLHHADCWAITGTCQVPHYNH
jgi:ribosomal protein L37AE/L43A